MQCIQEPDMSMEAATHSLNIYCIPAATWEAEGEQALICS